MGGGGSKNFQNCVTSFMDDPLRYLLSFSGTLVVYVADDPARAKEAESILKFMGYANVQCYLAGMREWDQVGGLIKYPKFVTFAVSQSHLIPRGSGLKFTKLFKENS